MTPLETAFVEACQREEYEPRANLGFFEGHNEAGLFTDCIAACRDPDVARGLAYLVDRESRQGLWKDVFEPIQREFAALVAERPDLRLFYDRARAMAEQFS